MTKQIELQKIAQRFGYNICQVPKGYFISERDREDPRRVHDSLMLIGHDGEITVYEHDAQAFLAAKVISQQIKAPEVKPL